MLPLSERVKYAIEHAPGNLTPTSVAVKIGCSREAILQWISGETKNIKNEYLFAFADLTGFEARWIATGEGPERTDAHVAAVLKAMQDMPEYRRADLAKISSAMAAPDTDQLAS